MNIKNRFPLAGLKTFVVVAQLVLPLMASHAAEYRVPSDYATIQEAIEAALADNNADIHIVLEDLVTYITDTIDISGFGPDKRLVLRPDPALKRAFIALQDGAQFAIYIHATSHVSLQDLDIVRFITNQTDLMHVIDAANITIQRCRLGSVWTTSGLPGTAILHIASSDIVVRNCIFFSRTAGTFDYGIRVVEDTAFALSSIWLYNNVVTDYALAGIKIFATGDGSLVILRNNIVLNHPSVSIEPWAFVSQIASEVKVVSSHNTVFGTAAHVESVDGDLAIAGAAGFLRFDQSDANAAFLQMSWPVVAPWGPWALNPDFFRPRPAEMLHDNNPATRGQTVTAGAPDADDRAVEDDIKRWPRPAGNPAHTDRGAHQVEFDRVIASVQQLTDHTPLVRFNGYPNRTYGIEASDDLSHWERLGSARVGSTRIGQFHDTASPRPTKRIYRVVWP